NAAGNLAFVDWAVPPAACMVPPLAICLDGQKSTSATPPIDGISRPTFERVCSRPMRRECQMEDSLRIEQVRFTTRMGVLAAVRRLGAPGRGMLSRDRLVALFDGRKTLFKRSDSVPEIVATRC